MARLCCFSVRIFRYSSNIAGFARLKVQGRRQRIRSGRNGIRVAHVLLLGHIAPVDMPPVEMWSPEAIAPVVWAGAAPANRTQERRAAIAVVVLIMVRFLEVEARPCGHAGAIPPRRESGTAQCRNGLV